MIRVNLLPREEKAQRKAAARVDFKVGDVVLPVVILAAAALVITGASVSQRTRMANLERSIQQVESESRALAPQIARVNQLAQERAELDLRMGIITKLEKGRTQSVRLMDELARCVPDHLWLSGVSQDGSNHLQVEGVTYSNLVVSDFMSRIERSGLFSNVELSFAERGQVSEKNVVKFQMSCTVSPEPGAN
ncbi:MAG: PilN domain-containing protein [Candidatus Eisenbacteria bacterium]|jgi:type IV pilus assembly protein PilN|nr:PilN domain-containing protein [Candidatus Eisenbacteria bacterium]